MSKESDLGAQLALWLERQDWSVYPEAQLKTRGPRADIIATQSPLVWCIEIKQTVSLQLLEQAYRWLELGALQVSIAVPEITRRKAGKHYWHSRVVDDFLRQHGIGLLFIGENISQPIKPKIHRYNYERSKRIIEHLDPRMKAYTPGNTAEAGYSSASSRVLEDALATIHKYPGISLTQLSKLVKTPFHRTPKIKRYILRLLEESNQVKVSRQRFEYHFY